MEPPGCVSHMSYVPLLHDTLQHLTDELSQLVRAEMHACLGEGLSKLWSSNTGIRNVVGRDAGFL